MLAAAKRWILTSPAATLEFEPLPERVAFFGELQAAAAWWPRNDPTRRLVRELLAAGGDQATLLQALVVVETALGVKLPTVPSTPEAIRRITLLAGGASALLRR